MTGDWVNFVYKEGSGGEIDVGVGVLQERTLKTEHI